MIFTYPATIPYAPEYITVHLGTPSSNSSNVSLPFDEYIKNVASSELYPDWPEEALRANIYAIVSFTLNRIFTEWYPSRGYDFDITNTTQYDQAFVNGRNYFENISQIVDEIFNDYIRVPGQIAPLFAQYCDGIQTVCEGLSQWGTVDLAEQGLSPFEILQYYYGENIQIIENAPILNVSDSYPGSSLNLGSESIYVRQLQGMLNDIRQTYSSIPPIPDESGVFDEYTEASVRAYQRIFNLTVDGIVGKATWYSILRLYISLRKLASLDSLGLDFSIYTDQYGYTLSEGDEGFAIEVLQYYLNYIAQFNEFYTPVTMSGVYDETTSQAVRNFQTFNNLDATGEIDRTTGLEIYNAYIGAYERN